MSICTEFIWKSSYRGSCKYVGDDEYNNWEVNLDKLIHSRELASEYTSLSLKGRMI